MQKITALNKMVCCPHSKRNLVHGRNAKLNKRFETGLQVRHVDIITHLSCTVM